MKKLGIIVPYRDRPQQLAIFKKTINEYLDIPFELIIVDQVDSLEFNRGKLLNIGFTKAEELKCDYVVLHDIDMLPIEADYSFSNKPFHLITHLDLPEGTDRTMFDSYFGGVTLFPSNIYKQINGYSNEYWGWGFEDDDLFLRCRENQIELNRKKVIQRGRDGVGLEFNGKDSYVAIPNKLSNRRDFTIFVSFSFEEINRIPTNITDENTIFSIPGFDTSLSLNSFFDIVFQFWKKNLNSISLPAKLYPEGYVNCVITIENRREPPTITLYINGKKIGENTYDALYSIQKERYLYLGVGNPDRKEKENWFKGIIDRFAIFRGALLESEIATLSSNKYYSLFNLFFSAELMSYYDMKFIKDNTLLDLEGNNNGIIRNCKQTYINKNTEKFIYLPNRRKGKFKVLPHKENGYKDGYWVNWASRENQLKYLNNYYSKKSNYTKDGLSTLKYKVVENYSQDNYHYLGVKL